MREALLPCIENSQGLSRNLVSLHTMLCQYSDAAHDGRWLSIYTFVYSLAHGQYMNYCCSKFCIFRRLLLDKSRGGQTG